MRLADRGPRASDRRDPGRPRRAGAGCADRAARADQRRVRVGQPDRAAPRRQRPGGVRRRPPLPGPRGGRPHASTREYYFNDFGAPDPASSGRRVAAAPRTARTGPRGRLPRRLRRRPRRATFPADTWEAADRPGRRPDRVVGRWASETGPGGHRGAPGDARRPLRRLEERGLAPHRGLGRAGDRAPPRAGGHVYEQDGAIWFRSTAFGDDKDRVIIRSNGEPTYFASDIGYVTEKFSRGFDRPHLHLGRRPSRHGRPGAQRGRGDGLRPGGRPDAPDRLGPLRPSTASRSR